MKSTLLQLVPSAEMKSWMSKEARNFGFFASQNLVSSHQKSTVANRIKALRI